MATRFYIWEGSTAPITPAVDAAWESSAAPFNRRAMHTTARWGDTLATVAGFTSTVGQDRCHRQTISRPMAAGNVFTTSTTFKAYAQVLEGANAQNIVSRIGVRILSQDGTTVRATLLAVADYSTATEWGTALRNKAFLNGDASTANYTTVDGDRLVVEWGHSDAAGSGMSGSSRWGSTGSTIADLGENETSTSTTERPWFETSLNITFKTPTAVNRYLNKASTAGGDGTTNNTSGTTRAWASISEALTGLQARDWATNNEQVTLNCSGTTADAPSGSVLSGTIHTAPDCYVHIVGDAPNSLQYDTTKYRIEPAKGFAAFVNQGVLYFRVSQLQIKGNPPDGATGYACFNISALGTPEPADCRADRVHITFVQNNTNTSGYIGFWNGTAAPNVKATFTNCVANGIKGTGSTGHSGFKQDGASTVDIAWYNCTAYDCTIGFWSAAGTTLAKNCGSRSCGDPYNGTFRAGSVTNASDLTDAPGTTPRNSATPTFVSAGTDFHLASGDTAWKDLGTDLSGDSRFAFTTDGDGATRSGTWDIGADEITVATTSLTSSVIEGQPMVSATLASRVALASAIRIAQRVTAVAASRVALASTGSLATPRLLASLSVGTKVQLASAILAHPSVQAVLASRVALQTTVRVQPRLTDVLATRVALQSLMRGHPRVTDVLMTRVALQALALAQPRLTANAQTRVALQSILRMAPRSVATLATRQALIASLAAHPRMLSSLGSRLALSGIMLRAQPRVLAVGSSRVALTTTAVGHPRIYSAPSLRLGLRSIFEGHPLLYAYLRTSQDFQAYIQGHAYVSNAPLFVSGGTGEGGGAQTEVSIIS